MNILIVLGILMVIALIVVSVLNEMQKKEQARRVHQRRLRIQVEELSEVLSCVEQTVGDKALAQKLNNSIIGLLQVMRQLESKATPYVESALQKSITHAQELDNPQLQFRVRYERESDAQINKTQQQLVEAIAVLSNMTSQGKLTEAEYNSYQSQLRWAHLMVAVTSFVAQGNKCLTIHDRVTAQAFYQRALHQLMESPHPNPKRTKLIREINEMLEGNRTKFSEELLIPDSMVYQNDLDAF